MIKRLFIITLIVQLNAEAQSSVLRIADSLYANGNYSKAINAYNTHDNPSEAFGKIAKAYMAIGNFGKALNNYELGVEANPDDALLKFNYAKLLTKTKRYKKAAALFNDLISIDYNNPNYHYEAGVALEKLKDSTAFNRFKSAYDLDQTHQKAIFKISKHHLIKRNFETSLKYIDKGLESYPDNLELINLKAQNYYHLDYYRKAIPWFEKLLELGEDSEFIHEKLSLCYAEYSDYERAIKHRKKALRYNPFDATAIYLIGTYYEGLNDFENAEAYISKAIKLMDVSLHREYQKLGIVLNRQKKHEAAINAFQKALKEDPKDVFTEFYIVRTKDEYYADRKAVVKLYEEFKEKHKETAFAKIAGMRLKELKEENFLEDD